MTDRPPLQDLPLRNRQALQTSTDTVQNIHPNVSAQSPSHGIETSQPQSGRIIYVDGALPDRSANQAEIGFVSSHPHRGQRSRTPSPPAITEPKAQELQHVAAQALLLVDGQESPQGNEPATEEARGGAKYLAGTEFGPLYYPPSPEGWREQDLSPSEAAAAGNVAAEQTLVATVPFREHLDQASGRRTTAPPAIRPAAQPKRICSRSITGFYSNGGHDPGGPFSVADKAYAGDQAAGPASRSADRGTADGAALLSGLRVPGSWRGAEGWPDDASKGADQAADRMDDD
ncbi:hypothetical protein B0A48_04295 [Cryoendolithus antarcticus]|uniref:Uncharacterized protein n=1 Tax=Cryoendolithus antarcticus TaxID=1507870 RepID=A0A1V8TEY6_9PEZI|nr:hypothetical protein B0A48_04295 [Cryoendolithus antarcticus]